MHYYKLLPGDHSALWENREALEKYLKRLKELWENDPEWQEACKEKDIPLPDIKVDEPTTE